MARKIVFTSGQTEVGQTTICSIVGCGLSMLNKKVLLMDLCVGKNSLHKVFNLDVEFDIVDVVTSRCRLKQAILPIRTYFDLYCLPCVNSVESEVDLLVFNDLLNAICSNFDFVLIDCPALMELSYYKLIYPDSETIIVSSIDKRSVLSSNNVASLVCGCENVVLKLFINNIPPLKKKREFDVEISNWLNIDLLGSLMHQSKKNLDFSKMSQKLCETSIALAKKL